MRITVELEQHELQVAKELIEALKSITDRLQVRTTGHTRPSPSADTAVVASTPVPSVPPAAGSAPSAHHLAPTNLPYLPAPQTAPQPSAPSPQGSGRAGIFWTILQNFTDVSMLDTVVSNVSAALSSRSDTSAAISELVDAFEGLLTYDPAQPALAADTARVERYFMLLNHKLPEQQDEALRKNVLQRIIRQLTKTRDMACDRAEVWPSAVGFGCLVVCECVKITGALAMIEKQLAKPTTVAAAVAMLGIVLSMCGPLVCTVPNEQRKVWQSVDTSQDVQTHPCFEYDRQFFQEWRTAVATYGEAPSKLKYRPPGLPTSTTSAPPSSAGMGQYGGSNNGMHHGTSQNGSAAGSSNTAAGSGAASGQWSIQPLAPMQMSVPGSCLAWDAASNSALLAGNDGSLSAWNIYSLQETIRIPSAAGGVPITLISTDPQRAHVLIASNPVRTTNTLHPASPYLALHSSSASLTCRAVCPRRGASHIGSILLLSQDTDAAISCETWPAGATATASGGSSYPVCLWSTSRIGETQELPPLHTWMDGHTARVHCSAASEYQPYTFFTGAADGVVRVWDTRMRSPAGSLQGTNTAPTPAHAAGAGIIAMECQGNTLVTAGTDAMVCIWDVRALGQPSVNALWVANPSVPVYKLAYKDSPSPTMAAVALGTGLYLLDWSTQTGTMSPCQPAYQDGVQLDVAWVPRGGANSAVTLLSIGTQPIVNVFAIQGMK